MSGESGVFKEELAAREEASLAFPGSALLEESGHDEGEGWGFDNMALTAMLKRRYATDAEPSVVVDWFNAKLSARGCSPSAWDVNRWPLVLVSARLARTSSGRTFGGGWSSSHAPNFEFGMTSPRRARSHRASFRARSFSA
jgi:hypothetical protein